MKELLSVVSMSLTYFNAHVTDFIIVCGVLALLGTISQMVLKVLFPVPQAKLLNQT